MPTLRLASPPKSSAMPTAMTIPSSDAPPRVPPEVEALRVAVRRRVAEHEAGDPVDRDLRERDHAAVRGEEDEACRRDPEEQHLREQLPDPVRRHVERRGHRQDERDNADDAVGRHCTASASRGPPEETERTNGEHDRHQHEREDDRVVRVVRGRYAAEKFVVRPSRSAPIAAPPSDPIPPMITTTSE